MRIIKLNNDTVHPPSKVETDFDQFVLELEKLSNCFGIAIKCVGDIEAFDVATCQVTYSGDFLDGDLEPRIYPREQTQKFRVEVTETPSRKAG